MSRLPAGCSSMSDRAVRRIILTVNFSPQGVSEDTKAAAYRTWLGFMKGFAGKLGWSAEELVQQANFFSTTIGAPCCQPSEGLS